MFKVHSWKASGQLLGGLIKAIHHSIHGGHCLDHIVKGLVPEKKGIWIQELESRISTRDQQITLLGQNYLPGLLGEDDEHAGLLVKNPLELLVQDHLTQLLLHLKVAIGSDLIIFN